MKKILFKGIAVACLALLSNTIQAQNICMVTADFNEAENYIVIWEQPSNAALLDSVYIYRKQEGEFSYTKIGSQSVDELSFFVDQTSNTIKNTWYRISFVDFNGIEGVMSPYHKPVVLDYQDGLLIWTQYVKEDQVDETWIAGYACMRDETGLGMYSTMGYWETVTGQTTTQWFDQEAATYPNFTYQMQIDLPSCAVTRANINTSRSNIKRQFSNSEASVDELTSSSVVIAPNPVEDVMNIELDQKFVDQYYSISDATGKEVMSGKISNDKMQLAMDNLEKGTYFLHIQFQGKFYSKAFMKN